MHTPGLYLLSKAGRNTEIRFRRLLDELMQFISAFNVRSLWGNKTKITVKPRLTSGPANEFFG